MAPEKVKVINKSKNPLPAYETDGSAGMDVRSSETVFIKPGTVGAVPTGLYIELPLKHLELQIRSRSGLAYKNRVFVMNGPGTLDSDYRGELKVLLFNAGSETFIVQSGDRIGQIVLNRIDKIEWHEDEELEETERGEGGFGSTGVQ